MRSVSDAQLQLNYIQIYRDKFASFSDENENRNIDVKVPVFEDEEETATNDGRAEQQKVPIAGISPQKGERMLSLNKNIKTHKLNQVVFDSKLI